MALEPVRHLAVVADDGLFSDPVEGGHGGITAAWCNRPEPVSGIRGA